MDSPPDSHDPDRREFFKKASAVVLGGIAAAVPIGAGVPLLLDPLGRREDAGAAVHVVNIDSLPEDGTPRKFTILASRKDAWNRYDDAPIGAVYLRRIEGGKVQALNVSCPHAGCFVDYASASRAFLCPCHNSLFHLDGTVAQKSSPSPRGMDSLEVEVRNGSEVWVKFQNFQAGHATKLARA